MLNVHDILQQLKDGNTKLPRPLHVLVKLSDSQRGRRRGECTAMCTQYPVHANGPTEIEAVVLLLNNLSNYLAFCAEQPNNHPIVYAPQLYLEAFDFGFESEDVKVDEIKQSLEIDVHVSRELKRFLDDKVKIRTAPPELAGELVSV